MFYASDAGRHLYESMGFNPTNEMRLTLKYRWLMLDKRLVND